MVKSIWRWVLARKPHDLETEFAQNSRFATLKATYDFHLCDTAANLVSTCSSTLTWFKVRSHFSSLEHLQAGNRKDTVKRALILKISWVNSLPGSGVENTWRIHLFVGRAQYSTANNLFPNPEKDRGQPPVASFRKTRCTRSLNYVQNCRFVKNEAKVSKWGSKKLKEKTNNIKQRQFSNKWPTSFDNSSSFSPTNWRGSRLNSNHAALQGK